MRKKECKISLQKGARHKAASKLSSASKLKHKFGNLWGKPFLDIAIIPDTHIAIKHKN